MRKFGELLVGDRTLCFRLWHGGIRRLLERKAGNVGTASLTLFGETICIRIAAKSGSLP